MHLAYGKLSLFGERLLHKQFIYEYNLNLNSFFFNFRRSAGTRYICQTHRFSHQTGNYE